MAAGHFLRPILVAPAVAHRLVNANRGIAIASRILPAFDSAARRTGLLGRTELPESDVLVIAPCNAVHSFGMTFPIDLLFVNRSGRVLKRVVALPRGRIAVCFRAFAVIECAAHHPGVSQTAVGDVVAVVVDPDAANRQPAQRTAPGPSSASQRSLGPSAGFRAS